MSAMWMFFLTLVDVFGAAGRGLGEGLGLTPVNTLES